MTSKENGTAPATTPTAWMRLDFDQATFRLDIAGEFMTVDVALAMLQQAQRELEAQQRVARAVQMQKVAREAEQVAALTQHVKGTM